MASDRTLARLDASSWILIFGGLFVLVLGLAARDEAPAASWSLALLGALGALAGAVLIVVRARLSDTQAPAAQSTETQSTEP